MQELLELIIKNITTHPEEATITMSVEGDMEVYTITVHPEDMGRVIGKSGKVIKAIRSLAHTAAIRHAKRYRINVAETGDQGTSTSNTANAQEVPTPDTTPSPDILIDAMDDESDTEENIVVKEEPTEE